MPTLIGMGIIITILSGESYNGYADSTGKFRLEMETSNQFNAGDWNL